MRAKTAPHRPAAAAAFFAVVIYDAIAQTNKSALGVER
jgi:hypothetical protein